MLADRCIPVAELLRKLSENEPSFQLATLIRHRADKIPQPGGGQTLARWRVLAEVGATDLTLAKLYEGHTDARAILAELGAPLPVEGKSWGVWCAEPPGEQVHAVPLAPGIGATHGAAVRLRGHKPWCSGAGILDQALVSAWLPDGRRCLVAVKMNQLGIRTSADRWHAVGMAGSASIDVHFDEASGVLVGAPGAYLGRPGFSHGGGGVAACWYGAAARIAHFLREAAGRGQDPHGYAHLGALDVALASAAGLLRDAAAQIDRNPSQDCRLSVSRARLAVEEAAGEVLRRVPRALGPGPVCRHPTLARLMADLPVFMRQSHAERDQAALGRELAESGGVHAWTL